MAVLTGSLETFALPDVFRLLAHNTVTGALRVERDSGDGVIYFRDGEVYFAFSSLTREFLGQRLVAAKLITQGQLLRVLDEQKRLGTKRLGDLLIEKEYLSRELLDTFIKEQIQDAVFHLLHWDTGVFSFDEGEVSSQEVGLSVSVENLIMEASRRIEEWEVIQRKIPSLDVVLRMAPTPPEDSVEINVKPEEWTLLVMADGVRTVREIAAATERSEFETAKVLYGLVSAGLLDVGAVPPTAGAPPTSARPAKPKEVKAPVEVAPSKTDVPEPRVPTEEQLPAADAMPEPRAADAIAGTAGSGMEEPADPSVQVEASVSESHVSEDWAAYYESAERAAEESTTEVKEWTAAAAEPDGRIAATEAVPERESAIALATATEDETPKSVRPTSKPKAEAAVSKEVLMRLIAGVRNL